MSRKTIVAAVILVGVVILVALANRHVRIAPAQPARTAAALKAIEDQSYLTSSVAIGRPVILAELERTIPQSYPFDVTGDARVYGNPSRGPITLDLNPPDSMVASTTLGGRIQVEKKILFFNASVGIDVSGRISAAIKPKFREDWSIEPNLGVEVHLDNAVAKTDFGDINVTGDARNAVQGVAGGIQGPASEKLAESLRFRPQVENAWGQLQNVYRLSETPPIWLRLTPQRVDAEPFTMVNDAVSTAIGIQCQTEVFIQEPAPAASRAELPNLTVDGVQAPDTKLVIPVALAYDQINQQLAQELKKKPIEFPALGATVSIINASIEADSSQLLLTVEFVGKRGFLNRVSGTLYITAVPDYDDRTSTLQLKDLQYTAMTESALLKSAEWLAHSLLCEELQKAAAISFEQQRVQARDLANAELAQLIASLPSSIKVDAALTEAPQIDRLLFGDHEVFGIISVPAKLSIELTR